MRHSPLKAHGLGSLSPRFNPYASEKTSIAMSIKDCIKKKLFLDALKCALGEPNLGKRYKFFRDIKNACLRNGQYQIAIDIAMLFPDEKERNSMLVNIYSQLADKFISE